MQYEFSTARFVGCVDNFRKISLHLQGFFGYSEKFSRVFHTLQGGECGKLA